MSAPPSLLSGEFAGRYTVERELGRGATSIVWLARDLDYGRMVAIKVLRDELTASVAADRFLREIRVTAQLQHPHIVPVLNSGEAGGRLYCVLPYMDGGTLRARLQRDKQLPIAEVVAIGLTVASALAAAHDRNLLHRDVKPENILFTGGQACLSDFGIARAIVYSSGESTTSTGLVRGTPAYMSPEQASGDRDYDGRSDLYALACVLYEALAGIPAFVGATSQAVVAQRILHAPRPIGVYRPLVSPELEAVLEKALATAPADRYQTATEFVQALAAAPIVVTRDHQRAKRISATRRAVTRLGLALIAVAAVVGYAGYRSGVIHAPWTHELLDTARVAVLPFDDDVPATTLGRADEMLYDALLRWRGISLVESFEVADAVRRSPVRSVSDARRVAASLRAGRFIVGSRTARAGHSTLHAALYDVASGSKLHGATRDESVAAGTAFDAYAYLADSLMLRGGTYEAPADSTRARNLPAAQAMIRARAALDNWDLAAADTLFARTLDFDRGSSRASLWLAQVRAWRGLVSTAWSAPASAAIADSLALTPNERLMATGLASLAAKQFGQACAAYQRLVAVNARDFGGWYGLGQCRELDYLVISDSGSPSGWRFRSSYEQAIRAYIRAFELLPSSYIRYQGAGYVALRRLLFTSAQVIRAGFSAGENPQAFFARPTLDADTIVMRPFPATLMASGATRDKLGDVGKAIVKLRAAFSRVVSGWAAAFPSSPGAKEGLGIALEMLGDPAAADTLRRAALLAPDNSTRLRLLVEATIVDVKNAVPDGLPRLRSAARTADSLLAAFSAETPADAELLARLAALTGRCGLAAKLAPASAVDIASPMFIPRDVMAPVSARVAFAALGCRPPAGAPSVAQVLAPAEQVGLDERQRRSLESLILTRLLTTEFPPDTEWVRRLAPSGSLKLRALSALADHDVSMLRRRLDSLAANRRDALRGDVTPDASFPEARLWLAVSDTAAAIACLENTLANARFLPPMSAFEGEGNLVVAAALVRSMALRADLAATDRRVAARWAAPVAILWSGADAELQPLVQRMVRYTRP